MSFPLGRIAPALLLLTASSPAAAQGQAPSCSYMGSPVTCNPYFEYFGGDVISNVKLYAVFWDATVNSDVVSGIPGFYASLANSEFVEWLSEYSTTLAINGGSHARQQGSGEVIGRGAFAGSVTLPSLSTTYPACPAPFSSRVCVTDAQIRSELEWQVSQGNLPVPDRYTLFVLHLPTGVMVYDLGGVGVSCETFCAYHNTTTSGNANLYYAVVPALDSRGCRRGCGMGSLLQNTSASASHEIAESITDAQVGESQGQQKRDYPLGWYDDGGQSQGEIGDLCGGLTDTLGSDGLRGCDATTAGCYTVQPIFSQAIWDAALGAANTPACVAARYVTGGDYSLALEPNSTQVPAGAISAPLPVVTQPTATADPAVPQPITLSVVDSPPGVHARFDRTSIDAGDTAYLTVSTDAGTTPIKDGMVVIQATGSQNHSAALLLQVTAAEAQLPTLSFVTPAAGAVVSGSVSVTVAAAAPSSSVASITLKVDGVVLATGAATSAIWNTSSVADGNHTLTATLVDAEGAAATASVQVTVQNEKKATAAVATPHRSGCSAAGSEDVQVPGLLMLAAALWRRTRRA